MDSRQVVITGLGAVSPLGVGARALWDGLTDGRVGIRRIQAFDPGRFPCQIAGEVAAFSARDYVPKSYRKAVKVMARDIELAVGAADTAVRDAGLITRGIDENKVNVDGARLSVNIGAGLICADLTELGQAVCQAVEDGRFSLARWGREGMNHLTPLWLLKYLPNMLACHVTIIHDARGPSNTITCADASAHLSVGEGTRIIQRGDADVGLCGGAESKLTPMGLLRQCLLNRLTVTHNEDPAGACRPFDSGRDGTVLGEGAGIAVLEEHEHARRRGARVLAEVAGFGASFAAASLTDPAPDGRGTADAIAAALSDAGMTPDEVDLIVPHGTGIRAHDLAEARGIHAALGTRGRQVPVWPIMAHVGNAGAGSGGFSLIAATMALAEGRVPAAINCPRPDPECGLAVVAGPMERAFRSALVLSYALGGQHAAVVVRKPQDGD